MRIDTKKHNKTRKQLEENNYRFGTVQTGIGSYLLSLLPGDSILRMAADRKIFIKSRKQLLSLKLPRRMAILSIDLGLQDVPKANP